MKKENDEVQSRRDFFKKAAKAALPIIGALVFANSPIMANTSKIVMGCSGYCSNTCKGSCQSGCTGSCTNNCTQSCGTTCSGVCLGKCDGTCMSSCYKASR